MQIQLVHIMMKYFTKYNSDTFFLFHVRYTLGGVAIQLRGASDYNLG